MRIGGIEDILQVLQNTREGLKKLDKGMAEKSDVFKKTLESLTTTPTEDPVRVSVEVSKVSPNIRKSFNDMECCKCDRPGVAKIDGKWYCAKHKEEADGVQE